MLFPAVASPPLFGDCLVTPVVPLSALPPDTRFSPRDFRDALGQFATGVTIITARSASGHPVGITVSSFNALSLTPPLVLWSLGSTASTLPAFEQCSHYAVHVLSATQKPLAELFARKGADRFAQTEFYPSAHGVPLLPECMAVFECRNLRHFREGDHEVFIGQVEHCENHAHRTPLLYHAGQMHTRGLNR